MDLIKGSFTYENDVSKMVFRKWCKSRDYSAALRFCIVLFLVLSKNIVLGKEQMTKVHLTFASADKRLMSGIVEISQHEVLIHREVLLIGSLERELFFQTSDSIEIYYYDPQYRYESIRSRLAISGGQIQGEYELRSVTYGNQTKPNIVLILADDLGYGSVEGYGLDADLVKTPNIRKLSEEGIKFTNAYTPSSVCSPTRYGLLTGRYDFRTDEKYGVLNVLSPLHIPTERGSLGRLIKGQGYQTAIIGKWHLGYQSGGNTDYTKELTPGPLDIGFDYQWAVPSNAGDAAGVWVENRSVYGLISNYYDLEESQLHPERSYYNERMLKIPAPFRADSTIMPTLKSKAISWLKQQTDQTPFFLYLPTTGIHVPVSPSGSFKGKSTIGAWGDYLIELDDLIGSVLDELDRSGLSENTIVIFTSDNGGSVSTEEAKLATSFGVSINGSTKSGKGSIWQGGFKVPYIVRWKGVIPAGQVNSQPISLVDTYATLSRFFGQDADQNEEIAEDSYNILPYWFNHHSNETIRKSLVLTSVVGIQSLILNDFKYIQGIAKQPGYANMNPWLIDLRSDPLESKNVLWQDTTYSSLFEGILNKIKRTKGTRPYISGNNKPQILTREIELADYYNNGDKVGKIETKDLENDTLSYYPIYGQANDLFRIDLQGNIFVKNAEIINQYETGTWSIKVQCSDRLEIDTAKIILYKGFVSGEILDFRENIVKNKFMVSPNPANRNITITFEGMIINDSDIELIDIFGKSTIRHVKEGILDVSNLANGIYILKMEHQNVVFQTKFIKN